MFKYLLILFLVIIPYSSYAMTTISNGVLSVGVDETSGYVLTSITYNSGSNLMPPTPALPGWQDLMTLWGAAEPDLVEPDPAKIDTYDTNYAYGSVDNYYWNMEEQSNSHHIGGVFSNLSSLTVTINSINVTTWPMDWNFAGGASATPSGYPSDTVAWAKSQGYLQKVINFVGSNVFHVAGSYTYTHFFNHAYSINPATGGTIPNTDYSVPAAPGGVIPDDNQSLADDSGSYVYGLQTTNPNAFNYVGPVITGLSQAQAESYLLGSDGVLSQQINLGIAVDHTIYATYQGASPWTSDNAIYNTDISTVPQGLIATRSSENWMALLKPDGSGNVNNYIGVGIYSPQGDISNSPGSQNTAFANSLVNSPVTGWDYYNGSSGVGKAGYGTVDQGGNYLEFDLPFNFTPGNVTPRIFGFDLYVAVGTIQQIRAAFYQIAGHTLSSLAVGAKFPTTRSAGFPLTRGAGVPTVR